MTTATGYYNQHGQQITRATYYAILAAKMRKLIGRDAALRMAIKNGSTSSLFRLACQLQAASTGTYLAR